MFAVLLALPLLAAAGAGAATRHTPPALGVPRFVQVVALNGLPADSTLRAGFLAGLRGGFADDQLPLEVRSADGSWAQGAPTPNRFRLLEGEPADDAWSLRLTLGVPAAVRGAATGDAGGHRSDPGRRTSRGMIAALELVPPATASDDERPLQVRDAFAFPPRGEPSSATLGLPENGYEFPWAEAGRAVARLALEELMRADGDLKSAERADISPAVRHEAGR